MILQSIPEDLVFTPFLTLLHPLKHSLRLVTKGLLLLFSNLEVTFITLTQNQNIDPECSIPIGDLTHVM